MSTVDMDLFSPAPQDEQHPEFAKAFLGFDPHDVEEFVTQAGERIAVLERQLRDSRAQVEGAHRHAAAAREEAYREVGSVELAKLLVEKADIAVSTGLAFGEYGEGFVRIALVENEHRIRQAARNIKKFLVRSRDSMHNVIPIPQKATR